MLTTFAIILGLLVVLVKSADLIEEAFISLSERFGINTFLTGFIILAFTSSLPETSVAVNSIIEGTVALSIGNILGATTIILTLIIGLSAIKHKGIPFRGFFGSREVVLALGVILAQVAAVVDGSITLLEGVILLTLYITFVLFIIFKSKSQAKKVVVKKKHPFLPLAIKSTVGVVGLIWSANILVEKAVELATIINVPQILIGLFMLSLGTNLPEIVLLVRSNNIEKVKLAAGNFIGSATFNTAILGIIAITAPYEIVNFHAIVTVIIVLTVTIAVFASMVNDNEISPKEGFFLLFLFFLVATIELLTSRHL